jgi:hypothetical protein
VAGFFLLVAFQDTKENEMHQPSERDDEQQAARPVDQAPPGGTCSEEGAGNKSKRGRPRLSDDALDKIVLLVGVGCSRRSAAQYVGCSPATIVNHMRRNEAFAQKIRSAEVYRVVQPLQNLRQQGNRSWRAAAWFLERIDRKQFGRQIVEVAPWQDVEKLFRSWTEMNLEAVADPKQREQMKARAQELMGGVKRCYRKY